MEYTIDTIPIGQAAQDRAQNRPDEVVVRLQLAWPARLLALPSRLLARPSRLQPGGWPCHARLLALPTWGTFVGPWRITHGNCLPLRLGGEVTQI